MLNLKFDIDIDNCLIAVNFYKKIFTTKTIIFLHDALGSIKTWGNFPEKTFSSSDFNVLVYDRLGHGDSDKLNNTKRKPNYLEKEAIVLNKIIEYLNLDEVILFGHSDGGTIALLTAAFYPQKIKAVITEGAHIYNEEITKAAIKNVKVDFFQGDLREKLKMYHGNKTNILFNTWANIWLSKEFAFWNDEHHLNNIKCPALIIQGENDQFGSLEQVRCIAEQTKGYSSTFVIPNVGHAPHKVVPNVILNKSLYFLKEINAEVL